ncbi:putative disease resistance protein (TIR-NBS-LRR class) [Melia azedarach]|uniref:Disease resistance protein (TIR-NBS-LRR class) n=1 Tax=Melia azedarach TaxID=155640 RepID=A0ACC1XQD8_MELAZ|nr:putative disease resistance protein (TIR-NBS-LRR class) [Melia azedarach]
MHHNKELVGVDSSIEKIKPLLSDGSQEGVCTLGIWGMGGIGKTTLARAIFNKMSSTFDASCFIPNVREKEEAGGLDHLRRKLLSTLLEDESLNPSISSFNVRLESQRLQHKKVLIVLDDVANFQQIEFLIGSVDWFMPGSLIIVTTRDKYVLKMVGVKTIYKMEELAYSDALQLFSQNAFRQNHPNVGYEELSKKAIEYAKGVPLALKALGSFLFGRSKEEWEVTTRGLIKQVPPGEIFYVLRASYDRLDSEEKNIFLDITCFLIDEDRDHVIKFLEAKGYHAVIGLSGLIDKGLVIESNNKITMHNLVREMGREIVRQESTNDPRKNRRLRHHQDIESVSEYNNSVDIEKIFVITNFVLEIPSAVFDQLSSVYKPHYAIVSMSLSFVAMLLCIIELVYKCQKEKLTWKRRRILPWLYYPSPSHKPFGTLKDIIGLICAIFQCIFATITFDFVRRHVDSPIKINFWPIVFALAYYVLSS